MILNTIIIDRNTPEESITTKLANFINQKSMARVKQEIEVYLTS